MFDSYAYGATTTAKACGTKDVQLHTTLLIIGWIQDDFVR